MSDSKEKVSLEAHVAACSQRYKTIFDRLNRIEKILLSVAGMVVVALFVLLDRAIDWGHIFVKAAS